MFKSRVVLAFGKFFIKLDNFQISYIDNGIGQV